MSDTLHSVQGKPRVLERGLVEQPAHYPLINEKAGGYRCQTSPYRQRRACTFKAPEGVDAVKLEKESFGQDREAPGYSMVKGAFKEVCDDSFKAFLSRKYYSKGYF